MHVEIISQKGGGFFPCMQFRKMNHIRNDTKRYRIKEKGNIQLLRNTINYSNRQEDSI